MAQTKLISDAEQAGDHVYGAGLSSFHNLTPRQQEVFDLLVAYIYQHGYPPTVQELAGLIGVTSPNAVTLHLRALHKKNFIKLSRGVSRGISVVGRKEPLLAVQLLQEMIADEPGARDRALEFLRVYEARL
ncbi:DNA-binding protein [Klebsiella oxytoca]|uniref:LexA family protein n=1 Tax=Klebsiella oxytoca TaxID=571 RepID=UPI00398248E4